MYQNSILNQVRYNYTEAKEKFFKTTWYIGTITISILEGFIISIISNKNGDIVIEKFEKINFDGVNKFEQYFKDYQNIRWFSNLDPSDCEVFLQYFEKIGYEFTNHNVNMSIERMYYNFQAYLNTKNISMSQEISKVIKNDCHIERKEVDEKNFDYIPSPELHNLIYGFMNLEDPLNSYELNRY